jgi:ribosomal protein S18 acetylase RimI-like enzyme
VFDAGEGDRLAAGMTELGYQTDRLIFMVHRGQVPEAPRDVVVEEFDLAEIRPLLVTIARRYDPVSDGTAELLADFRRVLVDRIGARFIGVRVDGEPVGYCELYVRDGLAQIEDVNTLEAFRGRGLARAFVTCAIREGLAAGAQTVFLIADASDWPQHFYGRLGFETVGGFREFMKVPKTEAASTAGV